MNYVKYNKNCSALILEFILFSKNKIISQFTQFTVIMPK